MLANVVSNLIANAVTSVVRAIWGAQAHPDAPHLSASPLPYKHRLLPILQRGAALAARRFTSKDSHLADRVKSFLSSPEAESVVRKLFSTRLLRLGDHDVVARVRSEFSMHFASFVHFSDTKQALAPSTACDALFDLLVEGCEEALGLALQDGSLSAHEAMSTARFHVIRTELRAIRTTFEATAGDHAFVRHALQFEEKYRRQVAERHRWIILPHLHTMHRVPSTSLFVPPLLRFGPSIESLTLEQFWASVSHAVIIGNPGAGKSTLLEYTCMTVASKYADRLVTNRLLTPIFINVAEYALACRKASLTVSKFAENRATSRYQLSAPDGAMEYLLTTGRVMVLFDGLDEVVDTARRAEICANIEAFCNLYPSTPIIVTSREVGYQHAPLREDLFTTFRIEPFDDSRISDFARKWFVLTPDHDESEAHAFARSLVAETATAAPDLRTNPLMLGLICNLYRSQGYIPEHRAEVYEKCAMLLYEQWDRRRNLPTLAFETQLKPVVAALAYWIYTEPPTRGGVTERELITRVSALLAPRKRNETQAREAALQFVDFCKGRAWVFTDIGADTETALYQFTHRTFLEYFTAVHLVGTTETVDDLLAWVLPRIEQGEWELVARMAFQIKARQTFAATDDLLEKTLQRASMANLPPSRRLLSFCLGVLEALVPSVDLTKAIAGQLVAGAIMSSGVEDDVMIAAPSALVAANAETRTVLTNACVHNFADALTMAGKIPAASLMMICSWMRSLLDLATVGQLTADGARFFEALRRLVVANETRCETVWRSDRHALLAGYVAHCCSAALMIRYVGIPYLFMEHRLTLNGRDMLVVPILALFADEIADGHDPWFVEGVIAVADSFKRTKLPLFRPFVPRDPEALIRSVREQRCYALGSDSAVSARFGAFIVAASVAEWWVDHLKLAAPPKVAAALTPIIRERFYGHPHNAFEAARSLGLPDSDCVVVSRWASRELDFVERLRTGGQSSGGRGGGKGKRKRGSRG
jgi:hypothetical protein